MLWISVEGFSSLDHDNFTLLFVWLPIFYLNTRYVRSAKNIEIRVWLYSFNLFNEFHFRIVRSVQILLLKDCAARIRRKNQHSRASPSWSSRVCTIAVCPRYRRGDRKPVIGFVGQPAAGPGAWNACCCCCCCSARALAPLPFAGNRPRGPERTTRSLPSQRKPVPRPVAVSPRPPKPPPPS